MTTDVSSTNAKKLQPFKKRKVELNGMQLDNCSIKLNTCKSEDTDSVPNNTFQESAKSPNCKNTNPLLNGKNDIDQCHSVNNDTKLNSIKLETPVHVETENNISRLQNDDTGPLLWAIKKIEEADETLTNETTCETNIQTCKIECNVNSTQLSTPSKNLIRTIRDTPSKVMKRSLNNASSTTPVSAKKEKKVIGEDSTPGHTPVKRKKRKVSSISDYDQLSDTIKSEFYDTTNFNDFEAIDLLHDLDAVMDFEDTKISPDILLSSITSNNIMQDISELTSEICNDPAMDPLFIASADELENTYQAETTKDRVKQTKSSTMKQKKTNSCRVKKPASVIVNIKTRSRMYKTDCKTVKDKADVLQESDSSEENSEFSQRIKNDLRDINIKMVHVVPLQHRIETNAGSRPPTQDQKNLFVRYGPLRKGTFSPSEDQIITRNWEMFCELHNWDPKNVKPFLYMRHQNKYYINSFKERQKFVQFLANGLPWRSLYSVYQRFRNMYHKRKSNNHRYTPKEDKMIISYIESRSGKRKKFNKNFAELARLLGRTRHSIWLRYQILKKIRKDDEKLLSKVEWTIPLVTKFIKNLLDVTLSEDIEELKNAAIPKPVWMKLEQKLNIDHNLLKTVWLQQLHMQLFCPRPIYLNDIKIQLIEYMYGKGISNTREIIWPNVAKYFEGITTIFLCKVFFHLVREITTKASYRNFPDIVEYLYHTKIPEIRNDLTDKYLPRLMYENGTINVINEDTSNYTDAE